jgi:hypothetical protein
MSFPEILTSNLSLSVSVSGNIVSIQKDVDFLIQDVRLKTTDFDNPTVDLSVDGEYHIRFTLDGAQVNRFAPPVRRGFYAVKVDNFDYNPFHFNASSSMMRSVSTEDMLICTVAVTAGSLSIVEIFRNAASGLYALSTTNSNNLPNTVVSTDDTGFIPYNLIDTSHLSAVKLATARKIIISGDAAGFNTFDGSKDIQIPVVINSVKSAEKLKTPFSIILSGGVSGVISGIDGSVGITASITVDPTLHVHTNLYDKTYIDANFYPKSAFGNLSNIYYRTAPLNLTVNEVPDLSSKYPTMAQYNALVARIVALGG